MLKELVGSLPVQTNNLQAATSSFLFERFDGMIRTKQNVIFVDVTSVISE